MLCLFCSSAEPEPVSGGIALTRHRNSNGGRNGGKLDELNINGDGLINVMIIMIAVLCNVMLNVARIYISHH